MKRFLSALRVQLALVEDAAAFTAVALLVFVVVWLAGMASELVAAARAGAL